MPSMQEKIMETRRPSRRSQDMPPMTSQPYATRHRHGRTQRREGELYSAGASPFNTHNVPHGGRADRVSARPRAGMNVRFVIALVATIAIIAAIAIGVFSCTSKTNAAQEPLEVTDGSPASANSSQTLVLNDAVRGEAPVSGVPERFRDCEETVDENGMATAGVAELIIAKHRNCAVTNIELHFLKDLMRFTEIDGTDQLPDGCTATILV